LRALLASERDIEVVDEAEYGRDAIDKSRELLPDVIVMDLTMPEMNGLEATRRIHGENSSVNILALSMHSDKHFVQEAISAGARGYLLKDCASAELVVAIRAVAEKRYYLSPQLSGLLVDDLVAGFKNNSSQAEAQGAFGRISIREREILQLIAEGKSTKEIAYQIDVSIKTVETHRAQIMKKLNLFSVAELTKYAIRQGLTTLS
jgi:DNA-binding NarL/FixJ family response regulator